MLELDLDLDHSGTPPGPEVLECEKGWVYAVLMGVGGYFGAFTYSLFC